MARRIIECTESDSKALPQGFKWRSAYTGRKGGDYMVRWDRGGMSTGTSHCNTLTQARKEAQELVKEGRAWAEVFRWAENGASMRSMFLCSYEVALECGSEVN